jgi:DNA mismatch endonuclease (patch repair protein)
LADIVDRATRSRMMAGIRGKDTRPEMIVRRALHARGFRYTLHNRKLPGRPDLCFPKYRAVIFVHGCFWHGHGCDYFRWPQTRTTFWESKIKGNIIREAHAISKLKEEGWRVCVVWECLTRQQVQQRDLTVIAEWLRDGKANGTPRGVEWR